MSADASPITQQEMMDMFGEMMPMEAVELLWQADDHETIGEVRAKLHKIATQRRGG